MQDTLKNRTIFCHDNLDIMYGINSNSIDLIYLDPPFNKKKIFTAPTGSAAAGASFSDIFREKDIKEDWLQTIKEDNEKLYNFLSGVKNIDGKKSYNFCYIVYMTIRLIECHRILKDTGSVYLHCDQTMSHYLKITLDCIFGEDNLVGCITWKRHSSQQKGSQFKVKTWGVSTDNIFHYKKGNELKVFKNTRSLLTEEIQEKFPLIDEKRRRYRLDNHHIFRTPNMGDRPNLCYTWKGFQNPHSSGWRLSMERLQEEYEKGNFVIKNEKLERRKYLEDYEGVPIGNLWDDIPFVSGKEKTGYPTQKPLALLERIINVSCPLGIEFGEIGIVLDPFCGCATTCVAAERLGAKWIGIDVSIKAYEIVKERLQKEIKGDLFNKKDINFSTVPPARTDDGKDYIPQKWVYVISNPSEKPYYKVGIAKDWRARLHSYQTADSDRAYKIEYKYLTTQFREIEKHIHCHFPSRHEWVNAELKNIIKEIENYETKQDKIW